MRNPVKPAPAPGMSAMLPKAAPRPDNDKRKANHPAFATRINPNLAAC
jgi:hypothetical protein